MNTLRFLLLEDNPLDAEIVDITLLEGGIDCDLQVVNARSRFEAALATKIDLILSDYALPGFDGLTALEIAQQRCPDIPFIFVSASLGEELAIESLKLGATDYVLKQRLGRLVPCVERALQEAREHRARKAAEAALQKSEDRLRLAIESAQLGTWDWDLRTNQLTWDAGCKAMFGLPPEADTSIDVFFEGLHPDDRDRLRQTIEIVQDPTNGGNYDTEFRTIGLQDQVERWIKVRGKAYFDRTGTAIRFIGTVLDITEQKRAAVTMAADLHDTQLLQELSARLVAEADSKVLYDEILAVAIALSRADAGTFQYFDANTSRLQLLAAQGFSEELTTYFESVAASSQTSCGQALMQGERAFTDFDAPDDPDGCLKLHLDAGLLSAQSLPLKSRSGKLIGMFSTHWRRHHRPSERELRFLDLLARQAADLIEQRQAEWERRQLLEREQAARQAAEQVNRIRDEFLAMLSHELRSPLNPILGWSGLLQSKSFDPPTIQRGLSIIEQNAKLQTQLVNDLLDISRILQGKLKLNPGAVDVAAVIAAAMEVVKTSAQAKSIALEFHPAETAYVRGDEGRLQQVVWNLLSNAIKFTPAGGRVEVRLGVDDHQAQIAVTDTGQGVSPDFMPYLFQSFRQEDASITRQHGGLGLGLAIAKHLVDAHGGTIMADSPGLGAGATFTVKLPLLRGAMAASEPPPGDDIDLTGIRVLAVDDSEDTRELLSMILSAYGAEICVVASGRELLANLAPFAPDLLICDIGMPDLDGYALLRQIRARPDAAAIPAIAVTAFAHEEDRQRALAQGFQQHVAKPFDPETLASAIAQIASE